MTAGRRMRRCVLLHLLGVAAVGVAFIAEPGLRTAAAAEPPDADTAVSYTLLGRGYAAIAGYPADEVPPRPQSEAAEPLPDQTCPEGQRGVPPGVAELLHKAGEAARHVPLAPAGNDVPTPRGQPVKLNAGIADASLRSDPGAHSIGAFLYVDLAGGLDPRTSAETDGYASGHARSQERCASPLSSASGGADEVHIISRARKGPYTYAFNELRNAVLPGGLSLRRSITVAEMQQDVAHVRGRLITLVKGVTAGALRANEIVTVIDYASDGTVKGTTMSAVTNVAGLQIGDVSLELVSGAPPVTAGGLLVGVAAPEARKLADGTTQITAGGLYVAGEVPNAVGLQAKQAMFVGGAWLDANARRLPRAAAARDVAGPKAQGDRGSMASATPSGPAAPPNRRAPAPPPDAAGHPLAEHAPAAPPRQSARAQPAAVAAAAPFGVFLAPQHVAGPVLVATTSFMTLCLGIFVWARARSARFRRLLDTCLLRWLDRGYRAFMRG